MIFYCGILKNVKTPAPAPVLDHFCRCRCRFCQKLPVQVPVHRSIPNIYIYIYIYTYIYMYSNKHSWSRAVVAPCVRGPVLVVVLHRSWSCTVVVLHHSWSCTVVVLHHSWSRVSWPRASRGPDFRGPVTNPSYRDSKRSQLAIFVANIVPHLCLYIYIVIYTTS